MLLLHSICLRACKICVVFVERKPEINFRKLRKVLSPPQGWKKGEKSRVANLFTQTVKWKVHIAQNSFVTSSQLTLSLRIMVSWILWLHIRGFSYLDTFYCLISSFFHLYVFSQPFFNEQSVIQSTILSREYLVWIHFTFSLSGCHTKAKEPSLPYY